MMDIVLWALAAVLVFLAAYLVRSKIERQLGVFFIIRSGYGIRVIESLARWRPSVWRFFADFSVLLSFGGVGGYYLSAYKETRKNFHYSLFGVGLIFFAASAFAGRWELAASFLVLSCALPMMLYKIGSPGVNFALTAFFIFLGACVSFDYTVSALLGVFGMPAALIYVMFTHGLNILEAKTNLPGVSPMLPTSRGGNVGVTFPGYDLFIPWWYALIALFITLVCHEGAHGVLVRVAKVRLKSTGILSFLSVPIGAFVEPDEEELNNKTSVDRMRVYTVGSFANLVVGVVSAGLILVLLSVFSGLVYSDGMRVVGFMDGYPAKDVLSEGAVVYSVNGKATTSLAQYRNATVDLRPGMDAVLNTSKGTYTIRLAANPDEPNKGYAGIYLLENLKVSGAVGMFLSVGLIAFVLEALGWVAFFNVNIALVNLLPIIPFDGGRMFKEVVSTIEKSEIQVNRILYAVIAFTAVVFLVNVIPLLKMIVQFFFTLI